VKANSSVVFGAAREPADERRLLFLGRHELGHYLRRTQEKGNKHGQSG